MSDSTFPRVLSDSTSMPVASSPSNDVILVSIWTGWVRGDDNLLISSGASQGGFHRISTLLEFANAFKGLIFHRLQNCLLNNINWNHDSQAGVFLKNHPRKPSLRAYGDIFVEKIL